MSAPTPNPLRYLVQSLGLSQAGLAASLGLTRESVRAALAEPPSRVLDAYLRLWAALQVLPPRLTVGEPVRFSVRLDAVDRLYGDGSFRKSQGLLELPPTVGELRCLVRRLSRRRSLASIARRLETSFVPTPRGLANWRKTCVAQMLRSGNREDPRPLVPGLEVVERWRRHVLAVITSRGCPADPAVVARYRFESSRAGLEVTYISTRPMPGCVADWTRAGLEAMRERFEVLTERNDAIRVVRS